MEKLEQLKEYLPIILPLIILQFGLLIYTIVHILKHNTYKRGSRALWLVISIVGMEFIGPILYFVLGKDDE